MATRYVCNACRKASQTRLYQLPQLQAVSDGFATSKAHRSFSTINRKAASAAPSPAPYQQKDAIDTGKHPSPDVSTPPTSADRPRGFNSAENLARSLRENLPDTTETYIAYAACELLVGECARQADYTIPQSAEKGGALPKTKEGVEYGVGEGWWYETLGLAPTFETWAQVTLLHMYLLTVRLRCFPPSIARVWHQHLIDHFSHMAEDKMVWVHKIVTRTERHAYLKDIFVQWRGLQTGYDEGLVKGDTVLATAVWRNMLGGDADVDWRRVGEVVSYMRHVLAMLTEMSDEEIASGCLGFGGNPGTERDLILLRAKGMDAKAEAAAKTTTTTTTTEPSAQRRVDAPAKGRMMPEAGK